MNEPITHVSVVLDQAMLQTIRMGLAQMQVAAQTVEAHLNQSVQAALEAANPERPLDSKSPLKSVNGHAQPTKSV